jgi:hypothetical protein
MYASLTIRQSASRSEGASEGRLTSKIAAVEDALPEVVVRHHDANGIRASRLAEGESIPAVDDLEITDLHRALKEGNDR